MSEELKYLLSEIKDSSQDYIGTNGCRYQDLLREELDLLVNEIERLNNIIEDFEIELQREVDIREEDTGLEHNTFITINKTLKTTLKSFRELIGSDKE